MSIWGDPPRDDVVVARADALSPAVSGLAVTQAEAAPSDDLSSLSQREAVAAALAAGEKPESDKPRRVAAAETLPADEEAEKDYFYVTGSRVNLRDGPTTNSAIVGSVSRGDRAEILSDPSASWIQIRTERGVEAWIYGRFLSETPA